METLEERLRTELERLSPPADPSGVVDQVLRRGARRHATHRARLALLTVSVIAGSIAGYYALTRVFAPAGGTDFTAPTSTNGLIVYERHGEGGVHLFLISSDGSGTQQLTRGPVLDRWPAWSPDGSRLVFSRWDRETNTIRLALMDVLTGEISLITPPDIAVARPDWSPDGSRIAFVGLFGESPRTGIYVVNADGSKLRQLTDASFFAPDNPEWSADGSTIAFAGNRDGRVDSWDVYLIDPDGSSLRNVTNTPEEELSEGVIGWLPNGNLLLRGGPSKIESGPRRPLQTEQWVEVTTTGGVVREVFDGPANTGQAQQSPSISSDGRYVVFSSSGEGGESIRFMDLETGEVTMVTEVTGGGAPAWQSIPVG